MDSGCIPHDHKGKDPFQPQEREGELPPAPERYTGYGKYGHGGAAGRSDHVGEGIPHLEGQDGSLTGEPHQVRQRRHDGHGDGSLTGAGGHHQVEYILDDEHAEAQEGLGEHIQPRRQVVDDGIQDLAVPHEQGKPSCRAWPCFSPRR